MKHVFKKGNKAQEICRQLPSLKLFAAANPRQLLPTDGQYMVYSSLADTALVMKPVTKDNSVCDGPLHKKYEPLLIL